ncbi:MAG TPA: hypothetical protein VG734_25885 [Lacunisphaera sp.]|nr:hypothetical protein [Lacunisphaera sp.]
MDLSHCTYSEYDSDGFLGIQADAYASGGRGVSPGHHLSPGGLDHRPVDPQGEVGELCLVIPDGHQNFVLPLNDVRTEARLPNLNKGATRLFDTGTFGGFPFHFTALLDPIDQQLVIESHRPGGKVRTKNAEGATLELAALRYAMSGLTSIELGGQDPLAKFALLATALTDVAAALAALMASSVDPTSPKVAVGKATSSIAAFGLTGSTLITKGA